MEKFYNNNNQIEHSPPTRYKEQISRTRTEHIIKQQMADAIFIRYKWPYHLLYFHIYSRGIHEHFEERQNVYLSRRQLPGACSKEKTPNTNWVVELKMRKPN